jgi:hypothetical protein
MREEKIYYGYTPRTCSKVRWSMVTWMLWQDRLLGHLTEPHVPVPCELKNPLVEKNEWKVWSGSESQYA